MEAPLLWGFQYKYCRGYLLIKTNSVLLACFPRVTMQSSWNNRSECIKAPGVESVSPQPLYLSPVAFRPYRGGVQLVEPSRPALAHFSWHCHPRRAEPSVQMKDRSRSPASSPFKPLPKAISLNDNSIPTVEANCFCFKQVGPYSLSFLEVHWSLFGAGREKKRFYRKK